MFEVEYKIEIPSDEQYLQSLEHKIVDQLGFSKQAQSHLVDNYYNIKESPLGGYDFERIRQAEQQYIHTVKVWVEAQPEKRRQETESALSEAEAQAILTSRQDLVTLSKTRQTFAGHFGSRTSKIDLDRLQQGQRSRAFLESEVLVEETEPDTSNLRSELKVFLTELIGQPLVEAPSMLEIALGR